MKIWKDILLILLFTSGSIFIVTYVPGESLQGAAAMPVEEIPVTDVEPEVETFVYGISLENDSIEYHTVRPRQFLSDILQPYGVPMQKIHEISLLPDTLFNERKIKPGNLYAVISSNDTTAKWFVYEKDPVNYVAVRLDGDGVEAFNGRKSVIHRFKKASGTIESSLWETMSNVEINPMLAVELSEIYAWSIDFFGLQQGDRFKVLYEESYVDSVSTGIHQITGAWFVHNNTEFWAIPFVQDGTRSFFDEEGNSLRKAFLKAPLRFSRISSGYSSSRFHPILKIYRPHHGIDYAAPAGTPVMTVGDGLVVEAGYTRGAGNYVKIKHNSVYTTSYLHLSRFGKGVRKGAYVKQGDIIGYVGSTGLSTGPHLDFRFYKNGSAVNPLKVEAPPVEPVHEQNLGTFNFIRELTMRSIQSFD